MKRFTILFTTLISVLALLAVFQAWSESRVEAKQASIAPVYDSTGAMLEVQNKPVVSFGNALELQYAQPWIDAQNKPVATYSNALEMQYARPWLDAQNKPVVEYGNALELQYAQPWLDTQQPIPLNCHSSLEMLYACQYGRP